MSDDGNAWLALGPQAFAFMAPRALIFVVVKPSNFVGVTVELVGGRSRVVVVLAVVTRASLLFGPFAHDVQLFARILDNLLEGLFKIHSSLSH
jgi:hypothetical protein